MRKLLLVVLVALGLLVGTLGFAAKSTKTSCATKAKTKCVTTARHKKLSKRTAAKCVTSAKNRAAVTCGTKGKKAAKKAVEPEAAKPTE
jgi:hypothetical protein